MCVVCCSFDQPPTPVSAAYRLIAAKADLKQAETFLESLGFTGLRFMSDADDLARFKFRNWSEPQMESLLGKPRNKGATVWTWTFGKFGAIAVWPGAKKVSLRNSAQPDTNEVEPPAPPAPKQGQYKTGTENDDSQVPLVHITDALHQEYMKAQREPRMRLRFMADLWKFFNQTKFQNKMRMPNIGFMKEQSATRMRIRAYWRGVDRKLKVSPRLFNASQEFFVETFLHEMCHQATYEIGAMTLEEVADNRRHKGHGRVWAKWMKHVGLNPLRYDPNENTVYMTEEEKIEHKESKDKWRQTKDDAEAQGLRLARNLYFGMPVVVRRTDTNYGPGGLVKGYAVCLGRKKGNTWAILSEDQARGKRTSNTWMLNPADTVYADPSRPDIADDATFQAVARPIINMYSRNALLRKQKRQMRNHYGLW